MPIQKVDGGYKWGEHGKVYPTEEEAEKQAQAAYAHGYTGDEWEESKHPRAENGQFGEGGGGSPSSQQENKTSEKDVSSQIETPKTPIGKTTHVELNGKSYPVQNSNGQPIQPTVEGVRNFYRWFGDSDVVNEDGEPLIFYHSGSKDFSSINSGGRFDGSIFVREGSPANYYGEQHALYVKGPILDLTEMRDLLDSETGRKALEKSVRINLDDDDAELLAEALTDGSNYPTDERVWQLINAIDESDAQEEIQKLRAKVSKELGYEAVRTPDEFDGETVMVLSSQQIKSATGNKGTYDPKSKIINDSEITNKPQGAGILYIAPSGRILLLKRCADSDEPRTWCTPGGKVEPGEDIEEAAKRESMEEIGALPYGERELVSSIENDDGLVFHTFKQPIMREFKPKLNGEHTGYLWASLDDLPNKVHPGVLRVIEAMNKPKQAQDAEHWITTENGQHLLIEGTEGGGYEIKGGAGGKLNGTKVNPQSMSAARSTETSNASSIPKEGGQEKSQQQNAQNSQTIFQEKPFNTIEINASYAHGETWKTSVPRLYFNNIPFKTDEIYPPDVWAERGKNNDLLIKQKGGYANGENQEKLKKVSEDLKNELLQMGINNFDDLYKYNSKKQFDEDLEDSDLTWNKSSFKGSSSHE